MKKPPRDDSDGLIDIAIGVTCELSKLAVSKSNMSREDKKATMNGIDIVGFFVRVAIKLLGLAVVLLLLLGLFIISSI